MIRINLLPEKEIKRRRAERAAPTGQFSGLTMAIVAAIFALIGGYYYFGIYRRQATVASAARVQRNRRDLLDTQIEKRQRSAQELQKVERLSKSMLDIVYALDPEDRLLWSEKINQLSDLIPTNVYVTNLTVTEAILKKETAGSKRLLADWQRDAAGKAKSKAQQKVAEAGRPATIFYPEIVQTLQIQAIASSENDAERIRLINEFYDNLKKGMNAKIKADFMKGFMDRIEIGDVAPRAMGGRNVADFSFTLKTKPTGARDTELPAPVAPVRGGAAGASEEGAKVGGKPTKPDKESVE
jgi:Tfp pilus assembly protein PilN